MIEFVIWQPEKVLITTVRLELHLLVMIVTVMIRYVIPQSLNASENQTIVLQIVVQFLVDDDDDELPLLVL